MLSLEKSFTHVKVSSLSFKIYILNISNTYPTEQFLILTEQILILTELILTLTELIPTLTKLLAMLYYIRSCVLPLRSYCLHLRSYYPYLRSCCQPLRSYWQSFISYRAISHLFSIVLLMSFYVPCSTVLRTILTAKIALLLEGGMWNGWG